MSKLILKPIHLLWHPRSHPYEISYDTFCYTGWFSSSANNPPNRSGLNAKHYRCPMDESCIYSTLLFIIKQAKAVGVIVLCMTFDQPLWLEALGIVKDAKVGIVCLLRGFHTMMSFLGSLGNIMGGSGIEDLFTLWNRRTVF